MSSSRVNGLDVDTGTEGTLEAFELQPPLWELVSQLCPEKETGEVRRILGHSLVEQACDLYEEANTLLEIWRANTLLEIWRQFREDTERVISRARATPCLPEPPAVRERLVQEIQFFVEYLQQQQRQRQGGSGVAASTLAEENSRAILDYVARTKEDDCLTYNCGGGSRPMSRSSGGGSRPMSVVSSRDGREMPLRYTPSSEEGSQSSVLSDHVEIVNAMDIDAVVKHLRDVLENECAQRRRDILFLQDCLDGEEEHQRVAVTEATRSEPTLQELREFGTRLEQEILHKAKFKLPHPPPPHTSRSSPSVPRLLPHLPSPPPPAASVTRASRVKRGEASFHPSYSSKRTPKQSHDSTCVPIPDSSLHCCHSCGAGRLPGGTDPHSVEKLPSGTNSHSVERLPGGTNSHSAERLPGGTDPHSAGRLPSGTNSHSAGRLPSGTNSHSAGRLPGGTDPHGVSVYT